MSIRLPADKLDRLHALVTSFSEKDSASKRQLQSLAGSLNFACDVVHGGRTFLKRVIDCIDKLRHSSHRCRLSSQFRANILWWKQFLATFNGRGMMLDFRKPIYFQTDASLHGFGVVCSNDWFASAWTASSDLALNNISCYTISIGVTPVTQLTLRFVAIFTI